MTHESKMKARWSSVRFYLWVRYYLTVMLKSRLLKIFRDRDLSEGSKEYDSALVCSNSYQFVTKK